MDTIAAEVVQVTGQQSSTAQLNFTTTTDIYQNLRIAPQWHFTIVNCITTTAVITNLIHITLMAHMKVGVWTAAKNFKSFVIYLAVTDLVLSAGRLSLDNYPVQTYMHGSRWLCITSATLIYSFNVFQMNLLALASLERFIAVCTGANYSTKTFVKHYPKLLGLCLAIWLGLYGSIAAVFNEAGYTTQGAGACRMGSKDLQWLDLVPGLSVLINLIILILFYGLLLCKSAILNRNLVQRKCRSTVSRRSARLNRTVGALVMTKIVLWLPVLLQVILRTVGIIIPVLAFTASYCLDLCSIANPVLYGLTCSKYRKYIRTTLFCQQSQIAGSSSNGTTSYTKNTSRKSTCMNIPAITALDSPGTSTNSDYSGTNLVG